MKNKDFTLLAIAYAQDEGLTPVQLQKSLFLLSKSGLPGLPTDFYAFIPYNYGPFNPEIYADADKLADEGMVFSVLMPGRTWAKYVATSEGTKQAQDIAVGTDSAVAEHLKNVVDWVKRLGFSDLLRAIYASFPEFRVNSVFQD